MHQSAGHRAIKGKRRLLGREESKSTEDARKIEQVGGVCRREVIEERMEKNEGRIDAADAKGWKRMKMDEEDGKVARRKEGEEWRGRKKEGLR